LDQEQEGKLDLEDTNSEQLLNDLESDLVANTGDQADAEAEVINEVFGENLNIAVPHPMVENEAVVLRTANPAAALAAGQAAAQAVERAPLPRTEMVAGPNIHLVPNSRLIENNPLLAAQRFISMFQMAEKNGSGREKRGIMEAREVYDALKEAGPQLSDITGNLLKHMEMVAEGIVEQSRDSKRYLVNDSAQRAATRFLELRKWFDVDDDEGSIYSNDSVTSTASRQLSGMQIASSFAR